MDRMVYEKLREEAIERFTVELRNAFDRVFESTELSRSRQVANRHTSSRRLTGLKRTIETAVRQLLKHEMYTFTLDDVIKAISEVDFALAKRIDTDAAKKASASSILKRLTKPGQNRDQIIEIEAPGEGRRQTRYAFTETVMEREELDRLRDESPDGY